MELLAPAGSIEMLETAVRHRADAVYLGVESFSARAKATDFTTHNLKKYVAYCHKFGVKVYLTLNTLVRDAEMREALDTAFAAVDARVDGVLVQDLGLAANLRANFPDLTLHASTQMGIHNVLGAQVAESLGFRRVVLARETPLSEIAAIKRETSLEVEVFVHGALCVSLSGNCYYSSLVSGNSGNRGRCLQLCRKTYRATCDACEKTGALLSPSDLCLIDRLEELRKAGVDSLKIEGRMKRPEYVGVVLDAYRKALNGERITREDREGLAAVFSRGGFCEGYLDENPKADFVGKGLPNHTGLLVGTVSEVTPNSFTMRSDRDFSSEDGFKVVRDQKEICGATCAKRISSGIYRLSKRGNVRSGDRVYLTTDARQLAEQRETVRKLPLCAVIRLKAGKPPIATLRAGGKRVVFEGRVIAEPAVSAPLSEEDVTRSFSKLQETDYVLERVEIEAEPVFLRKSDLNDFRRAAIEALDREFLSSEQPLEKPKEYRIFRNTYQTLNHNRYYVCHSSEDLEKQQLRLSENDALIFAPGEFGNLPDGNERTYLQLPILAFGEDLKCLDAQARAIATYGGIIADNLYAVAFARRLGMPVIAGFGLNVANHGWAETFADVFFSAENLSENDAVAFGFGEFPLMTFAHCPYCAVGGGDCRTCPYDGTLRYEDAEGKTLRIRRFRTRRCYFSLCDRLEIPVSERYRRLVLDSRGSEADEIDRFLDGKQVLTRKNYFLPEWK